MMNTSTSISASLLPSQKELFRPSLNYPTHPYDEMLTHSAQRFPENVAVVFREVNLTYRELDALVNSFANALVHLGVGKGQKVCVFMTNRAEYLISWFAVTRIGATVSPINPAYKEREVAYQLSNSEAVAVVVQRELLPLVEAVRSELPALKQVITVGSGEQTNLAQALSFSQLVRTHPPTPPTRPQIGWEEVVALPYSSGTTGLPKGVLLSHKNLVCNACQMLNCSRITSTDRLMIFLPLYHIFGILLLGSAAMAGATAVVMERFEPTECLRLIQEQRVTLLYAVPQILSLLLNWPQLNEYDLRTVRHVMCAAAPVSAELARRFQEVTNVPVVTSFGLTESGPAATFQPVYDQRLVKVETSGLPANDTRLKIVDIETGQRELGFGQEGEILIQGPQVMQGYWKAPEATAEALRDGWLYTGDIGWLDEEGYVSITDRKKEMIKFKGFSVAPAQIEALLLEHPAVDDVAVVAKPDEEAGEVPKAFVVLKAGHENLRAEELMAWANGKLATFKNVREIEFVEAIPRNPSGKILRRVLKEQERQRMGLS